MPEHALDVGAQLRRVFDEKVRGPAIASRQHGGDQPGRRLGVVVLPRKKRLPMRVGGRRCRQCSARRVAIQRLRVVDEGRQRTQSGRERRLARERGRERIDRDDAQSRRLLEQAPTHSPIPFERGTRKAVQQRLVRTLGPTGTVVIGASQCGDDAVAHFRSSLARERHGDDRFGPLDMREQREKSLDQKLRLAGTGRRLHQPGSGNVERFGAGERVLRDQRVHRVIHRVSRHLAHRR